MDLKRSTFNHHNSPVAKEKGVCSFHSSFTPYTTQGPLSSSGRSISVIDQVAQLLRPDGYGFNTYCIWLVTSHHAIHSIQAHKVKTGDEKKETAPCHRAFKGRGDTYERSQVTNAFIFPKNDLSNKFPTIQTHPHDTALRVTRRYTPVQAP
jgi:hypothetical protein